MSLTEDGPRRHPEPTLDLGRQSAKGGGGAQAATGAHLSLRQGTIAAVRASGDFWLGADTTGAAQVVRAGASASQERLSDSHTSWARSRPPSRRRRALARGSRVCCSRSQRPSLSGMPLAAHRSVWGYAVPGRSVSHLLCTSILFVRCAIQVGVRQSAGRTRKENGAGWDVGKSRRHEQARPARRQYRGPDTATRPRL